MPVCSRPLSTATTLRPERERKHRFDPHDVRETAARFRVPAPRQEWVEDPDSNQLVNSADAQKRGMPPYLLVFDLVFSAVGGLCTEILKRHLYSGAARFFMLFMTLMWPWVGINARLNAYDPEDISFELYISLLMAGMMSVAFHLGPCFFQENADDGKVVSVWSEDANHCFDFAVSFSFVRTLMHALGLYIAYHVPEARRSILRREARTLLSWLPFMLAVLALSSVDHPLTARLTDASASGSYFIEGMLFASTAVDALLTSGQAFLGDGARGCHLCSAAGSVVPMNIKYFEARYERMMVISIGSIIAGAASKMSAVQTDIQMRADYRLSIFVGTPWSRRWMAFIVKVFYFDLSPHQYEAAETHAMRVSKRRGAAWTLLHLPLFGSVRWISAALQALIAEEDARRVQTSSFAARRATPGSSLAGADDPARLSTLRKSYQAIAASLSHGNLSDATPQILAVCKQSLAEEGTLNCDAVADADALNFCASLVLYLACVTSVQVLHRGAGKRQRRIGKKWRLLMRACAMALLLALALASVRLSWSIVTFFGCTTGLVTALAAFELWGRGFSTAPDETAEGNQNKLRAVVGRWMQRGAQRADAKAQQAAVEHEERSSLQTSGRQLEGPGPEVAPSYALEIEEVSDGSRPPSLGRETSRGLDFGPEVATSPKV